MKKNKTSLIICAKNEARSIGQVIQSTKKYADQIIVVDGKSSDNTKQIAKKLNCDVLIDNGKGKGAAIRLGVKKTEHNIIIFMDADGSHIPQDIPRLTKPIIENNADFVIASRSKGGSDELQGDLEKTLRLIGSSIITLVINLRFKTSLTDSQNGFRAISKDKFNKLILREDSFTIEQEMLISGLKKGLRVREVASFERARQYGESHISLKKMSWRYVWCLIKNIL